MNIQLTITIAGQDHPQLINQLAAKTHELGGKWLVSKINRLDNQIVGLIKVDIPAETAAMLKEAFNRLTDLNVRIIEAPQAAPKGSVESLKLKVESSDRPGIVNDITNILDDIGIEIVKIENYRIGVADLGQALFIAELMVEVPSEVNVDQLLEAVQQVEEDMRVSVVE
ncbi:transcriptional regulator [Photobacterium proteolyticum]|uniref:Glycine cleavage system transcriptional repressor n=2 Tax=Photobacterium TaxID=657 RepID=A0A1Q9G5S4_9GAMM|nr:MULTISPECIES: ACT domain-containing protein [Photobacterium]NBI52893.1 transcriptional regulator [Photobacterium alginatilyticum]OLQ69319.1 transcriptional regulator [Photobacterium proteolyticum]